MRLHVLPDDVREALEVSTKEAPKPLQPPDPAQMPEKLVPLSTDLAARVQLLDESAPVARAF